MADPPVPRRPGPVYDDAIRILVDNDLQEFLDVMSVGKHADRLNPTLPASTVNADLVVRTPDELLHVEFVKDATPDLAHRMVDYRLRLLKLHRGVPITQNVLVLGNARVPDHFTDGSLHCTWTVTRVADQNPTDLLRHPTTAGLATLTGTTTEQCRSLLIAAAERILAVVDRDRAARLLGAATTLAAIVLPRPIISSALKEVVMPLEIRDTPFGEHMAELLREEGLARGREQGREQGEHSATLRLTTLMLRQRYGDDPRIPGLAAELVTMPDEDRLHRIDAALSLEELERR